MAVANSFEGGTSGTTITAANSGGGSGDAFNTVTGPPAAGTLAFDAAQSQDTLAAKIATAGTAGTCMVQWIASYGTLATGTEDYGRAYFRITGTATTAFTLVSLRNGAAGANVASRIQVNTSNRIVITDGAPNVVKATGTVSIPANQWVRIEYRLKPGATSTTGEVEVRLYLNGAAEVGSHDEVIQSLTVDTGSVAATAVYWGLNTSAANMPLSGGSFWLDNIRARDTTWSGPASQAGLPSLVMAPRSVR